MEPAGCRRIRPTASARAGASPVIGVFLPQGPVGEYAGGASSKTAGTTALAGHFFRFLLSTVPQWVQLGGILVGVPVAAILAWQVWKRRAAIWAWWKSRPLALRFTIIAAILVVATGASATGLASYNYVMHQNDFCQSCHIMDTAWNRFQVSAHKNIQCHACHRQPLYVSSVELFYWVTERRMEVPEHDKVPTAVCDECHMQQGTDSAITLVSLTAGHAVHLRSDSSALKNVQCVTCHGYDFHIFVPNKSTCEQSGCHTTIRVNLGAMSGQSFPHCTICHDFRSRVSLTATVAEAKVKLTPKAVNCFSCHAMTQQIGAYDLAADPHKGNCGICHNPHTQTKPADAFKSCAQSQCHGAADTLTGFHRGLGGHKLDQCGLCHRAHTWKVNGNDCVSCHKTIRPVDAPVGARAQRQSATRPVVLPAVYRRPGAAAAAAARTTVVASMPGAASFAGSRAQDTAAFQHALHKSITCTTCHGTTTTHGGLKFERPAGCFACHHGADQAVPCTTCHLTQSLLPRPVPVTFAISTRPAPLTRTLTFPHARHSALACTTCHANDVNRTVFTTCATCHTSHHNPEANCAGCHPTAREGHDRSVHTGCARCHTDSTVAALPVNRNVCLVCHQEQRDHYPTGNCATCHALANQDMLKAGRGGAGGVGAP